MTRQMIKQNAKDALRFRYWPIIGVELIAGALTGGVSGFSGGVSGNSSQMKEFVKDPQFRTIMLVILGIAAAVSVIGILYTLLFAAQEVLQTVVADVHLLIAVKLNGKVFVLFLQFLFFNGHLFDQFIQLLPLTQIPPHQAAYNEHKNGYQYIYY